MSGPRGCIFAPEDVGALLFHAGGRWKLWREREASVEVTHNDVSETYTAACWISAVAGETSAARHCIVLGCASGRIQAWDPLAGEPVGRPAEGFREVAQGADCAVSGLAASSASRGTIFAACNGSPEILEVGLADGTTRGSFRTGKSGLCRLAATVAARGQEWLLSAAPGAALKLWKLPAAGDSLGELRKASSRLAAPANAATCLELACLGGRLVGLCADGTMQVDFFDLGDGEQEGGKSAETTKQPPRAAARVLSCHERLVHCRLAAPRGGKAPAQCLVLGFGHSIVAVWSFDAVAPQSKKERTVAPVFAVTNSELGGKVLCARADVAGSAVARQRDGQTERIAFLVAYGPSVKPVFAQVLAPKVSGSAAQIVALAGAATVKSVDAQAAKQAAAKGTDKGPTVLGPMEIAAPGRKRLAPDDSASQKRTKSIMPASRPVSAGSNLSLAPILRQGLRSKDDSALDKTLVLKDRELMETSVAELSGSEAFDLLQECAKRLLARPMEGQVYSAWIQRVLLHHCSFIRSQPKLQEALRPLHDSTAARCAGHRGLVRLRGRLQHLVFQGKQVLERRAQEQATVRAPLLEYVEGDEELPDDDEDDAEQEDEEEGIGDDDDDEDIDIDADDWLDSDDLEG